MVRRGKRHVLYKLVGERGFLKADSQGGCIDPGVLVRPATTDVNHVRSCGKEDAGDQGEAKDQMRSGEKDEAGDQGIREGEGAGRR